MKLDSSKPHAKICGYFERYPKAYWEQAGRFFTKDGDFLGPGDPEPEPVPKVDTFPRKLYLEQPRKWEIVPEFEGMPLNEVRQLHWRKLKAIMEAHGVRYTTLKHAREWIES